MYRICFIQGRDDGGVGVLVVFDNQNAGPIFFHFSHSHLCIEKSDLLLQEPPEKIKRCCADLFVYFTPNQKIQ